MIESEVFITTKYGRQQAFAVCPDMPGRFAPVILYMDAPGMREELRGVARRISNLGYFCLVPDLYYRLGMLRFDIPRRNDAMSKVIHAAMTSLTISAVMDDTAGMIAYLDGHEKVKPGGIGCVGHCMSGPFAIAAAASFPRVKAAASLYGVNMVTNNADSPHLLLDRIGGEVYLGFAEIDPSVPPNVIPDFKAALEVAGTRHILETFSGAHHGFCFAARPDYHPVAAEASWERMVDLWARNLA